MSWFVYMLRMANGNYYTGCTNDIKKRIDQHNNGQGSKCVRASLPAILIYLEVALDKSSALKREHQIKKLSKEDKIGLIVEDFNIVRECIA